MNGPPRPKETQPSAPVSQNDGRMSLQIIDIQRLRDRQSTIMTTPTKTRRETMTSRQRLLKALNHETPDRVPIDLGGNQTGIHKFAYQALLSTWAFRTNS